MSGFDLNNRANISSNEIQLQEQVRKLQAEVARLRDVAAASAKGWSLEAYPEVHCSIVVGHHGETSMRLSATSRRGVEELHEIGQLLLLTEDEKNVCQYGVSLVIQAKELAE